MSNEQVDAESKWQGCREHFTCATCRHFCPCMAIREYEDGAEPEKGECRRMPPHFCDCDPSTGDYVAFWPLVVADEDWCGEWEPME